MIRRCNGVAKRPAADYCKPSRTEEQNAGLDKSDHEARCSANAHDQTPRRYKERGDENDG
jgi:hypothetical protein